MKTTTLCLVLAIAAALALSPAAQVAPPGVMNYQGVLRDASGAPLSGAYDMTFRIFDAASAGNEVIVDTHAAAGTGAVTVTGGLFNVEVGSGALADGSGPGTYTALSPVFASTTDLYLEVQVGAETLSPRIHFASAGTALNAGALQGYAASAFTRGGADETITGNWVNTANPWADNEVSDTLTVGSAGQVNQAAITLGTTSSTTSGRLFYDAVNDALAAGDGSSVDFFYPGPHAAAASEGGSALTALDLACTNCIGGAEVDESTLGTVPSASDVACVNCVTDGEVVDALSVNNSTAGYLVLEQGVTPGNTTEGRIQWDTDDDALVVGTGSGTAIFRSSTASDALYLRKDIADTAAGVITFTAASTDIRGQLLDGDSTYVTVGEDLSVTGGHLGVGVPPNSTQFLEIGISQSIQAALDPSGPSPLHGVIGIQAKAQNTGSGGETIGGTFLGDIAPGRPTATSMGARTSASGASDNTGDRFGLWATAAGGDGNHWAVYGAASDSTLAGTHYGVYGTASGGATNWGLYTPDAAYVGGKLSAAGGVNLNGGTAGASNALDFGAGANDDLTAADVTDLTDGGATALHSHDITGAGDVRYLRKDIADTAAGRITFTALPSGTGLTQGSAVVNPASATADYTLFGVGASGAERFRVDAEGDARFSGALALGTSTTGREALAFYKSSTGDLFGFFGSVAHQLDATLSNVYGGALSVSLPSGDPSTGTGLRADVSGNSSGYKYGAYFSAGGGGATNIGAQGSAFDGSSRVDWAYGLYGSAQLTQATSSQGTGVYGAAYSNTGAGSLMGVFGTASGGATNWGLYTPDAAFVGGKLSASGGVNLSGGSAAAANTLDFGGGANDDLTATDVTDLTDGGATTLHSHDITGAGDVRYLRKDSADTASGVITFTAASTDIRGQLVDNDSTYVTVGEDCYISGGQLGVGALPGALGALSVTEASSAASSAVAAGFNTINTSVSSGAQANGLQATASLPTAASAGGGFGVSGTASGAADATGFRVGVRGQAQGGNGTFYGVEGIANTAGNGTHYGVRGVAAYGSGPAGVYGSATTADGSTTHYGVYGTASGGTVNWGLYTPNDAYVGGTLDLGSGANDDLTATDVTDLTDGGTTTLHTHTSGNASTLDNLDSTQFLRSDIADTAAGDITFSSGHIAVGTSTNGYVAINSALTLDTTANSAALQGQFTNSSTTATSGTNAWGGLFSSTGSGTGSSVNVIGLQATGTGATDSDGVHTGVYGVAAGGNGNHFGVRGSASQSSTSGVHYGVYGTASGGTTNWGLYTPNNTFVGGTLTSGNLGVGVDPDADRAGNFSITGNVNGLLAGVYGSSTSQYTGGTGRAAGGFFEGVSSAGALTQESDGVYATATGPAGSTGSRYGVRAWAYGGNGVSVGVLGSAGNSLFPDSGTHYGLYGSAAGGATNWGIYTPDNANLGDATTDSHVFWGTLKSGSTSDSHMILPNTKNYGYIGSQSYYWYRMYANTYYGVSGAIQTFPAFKALDALDAMRAVETLDAKTGRGVQSFSADSLPRVIKGDPSTDGEGADAFVDYAKALGFTFDALREMRQEVRTGLTGVQQQIDGRTADPLTGNQSVAGNLSLQLDRDANDRARFSVFKDGGTAVAQELLRVDEEGNLHLKGALRPSALDLAEYHPLAGPASAGDVLVADRSRVGFMKRCDLASDKAVVGIVSTEPGVVLGSGLQRIAASDSEMAEALEAARLSGDSHEEARLWAELERRFSAGHAAIALSGTVPCKVDAAYGPIEVGDLLVASPTPGHAMRSEDPRPGTVVAKALEPLTGGTGVIKVLVMLR